MKQEVMVLGFVNAWHMSKCIYINKEYPLSKSLYNSYTIPSNSLIVPYGTKAKVSSSFLLPHFHLWFFYDTLMVPYKY